MKKYDIRDMDFNKIKEELKNTVDEMHNKIREAEQLNFKINNHLTKENEKLKKEKEDIITQKNDENEKLKKDHQDYIK